MIWHPSKVSKLNLPSWKFDEDLIFYSEPISYYYGKTWTIKIVENQPLCTTKEFFGHNFFAENHLMSSFNLIFVIQWEITNLVEPKQNYIPMIFFNFAWNKLMYIFFKVWTSVFPRSTKVSSHIIGVMIGTKIELSEILLLREESYPI